MSSLKNRNTKTAIKSVLVSLAIYIIASFLIVMVIYEGLFARAEEYGYHSYLCYEDMNDYPCRDIAFQSDGFAINGKIYGTNQDKLVILCHGKGDSGESMLAEVEFFLNNGYSAMVFDYVGHGQSEGNSQVGLRQPVYDLENAISFAKEQGYENLYLYGMGVGGYSAALCSDTDGVKAVASISAFNSIPDLTLEYATGSMSVFGYLEYPIMMLYQFIVFGSDISDDAVSAINSSDVPIIIINGTADDTIKYDGTALINSSADITNPKAVYKAVEGGLHKSLIRSEAANSLLDKFNTEAYELYNSYDGSVPETEIEKIYNSYSRAEMSELNGELMNEILTVFNSAE